MAARPHLIFVLADQLRSDVLGCFGGAGVPGRSVTPKLDLFAQRAMAFERHFTPCPLCVPARSSLMTGLEPLAHGAVVNGWLPHEQPYGTVRDGLRLLPDHLAEAGYRVVHCGVQHVRTAGGFEADQPSVEFIGPRGVGDHLKALDEQGLMTGDLDALRDPVIDFDRGRAVVKAASSARTAVFPLDERHWYDARLTDLAVEAIRGHAGQPGDRPLAVFLMLWLPHPPFWAPEPWVSMIDPEDVKLPNDIGSWFRGMAPLALRNQPGQLGQNIGMDGWRRLWAVYLGMVGLLDKCVGRVLAALDYAEMLSDAVVAVSSDHGEMLGSHRLLQKMCMYEPAVRVPLLVKTPGPLTMDGRKMHQLSDHLDLVATLTDYADAGPVNDNAPGRSLRPLLDRRGDERPPREHVFATYDGNAGRGFHQRMVRSPTHKLIHNVGDHAELYDLVEDPRETKNLIRDEAHRDARRALTARLRRWMDEHGDPQPWPR